MAANNAVHTRSRGDWNPRGNVMICYTKGLLLQNGFLCGVLMWLKQQVCTETQMFLAARMH